MLEGLFSRESVLGILLQEALEKVLSKRGKPFLLKPREVNGLVGNGFHQLRQRRGLERHAGPVRVAPREQLEGHHPGRVDIGLEAIRAFDNLWGNVDWRSRRHLQRLGTFRVGDHETEVGGLESPVKGSGREQEVLGLDIAVDEAVGVALRKEPQNSTHDHGHVVLGHVVDAWGRHQGAPFTELHHDVNAIFVLEHINHIDGVQAAT
mmetsp:Transcript_11271/g.31960  ORF Transcript_11271/g.31960 Transcript_11271/m.31960 type:complete len:207 (+) Transcript_11271:1421-2041(+)